MSATFSALAAFVAAVSMALAPPHGPAAPSSPTAPTAPAVSVPASCRGRCVSFAGQTWPWTPKRCDACVQAQLDVGEVVENGRLDVGTAWFGAHDRLWLEPMATLRLGDPVAVDGRTLHVTRTGVYPAGPSSLADALVADGVVLQTCATPDGAELLLVSAS